MSDVFSQCNNFPLIGRVGWAGGPSPAVCMTSCRILHVYWTGLSCRRGSGSDAKEVREWDDCVRLPSDSRPPVRNSRPEKRSQTHAPGSCRQSRNYLRESRSGSWVGRRAITSSLAGELRTSVSACVKSPRVTTECERAFLHVSNHRA